MNPPLAFQATIFPAKTWAVSSFDTAKGKTKTTVYLRAQTEAGALRSGKALLQMFGVRPYDLTAREWSAATDPDMRRWTRRVTEQTTQEDSQ